MFGRIFLSFLYLFSTFGGVLGKDTVVIEGVYEFIPYRDDKVFEAARKKSDFRLAMVDCDWELSIGEIAKTSWPGNSGPEIISTYSEGCIYTVHLIDSEAERKAWGDRYESVKQDLAVAKGYIYPGDYPPPSEPDVMHIWFAYLSDCILANKSGQQRPPYMVNLDNFYLNTNYFSFFEWSTDSEKNNRYVTIIDNGYALTRNPNTKRMQSGNRYLEPYNNGYVGATGKWEKINQISGKDIYYEFEFQKWIPKPSGQSTNDLSLAYKYRCIVTNSFLKNMEIKRPKLPENKVAVFDRRMLSNGYSSIQYVSTNGWISTNHPYIASKIQGPNSFGTTLEEEVARSMKVGHESEPITKRAIVITGIILISLGVGMFYYKTKKIDTLNLTNKNHEK